MMKVTLNPQEYYMAAQAGFMRQLTNVCHGRVDAYGFDGAGYDVHILGAVGEYVVARALGRFWPGIGQLRADDVHGLQVRTSSKPNHRLILHPDDADAAIFVLVTGSGLEYIVRGWSYGADGKQERYWQDPAGGRPAFFVPQRDLQPIRTLLASPAVFAAS